MPLSYEQNLNLVGRAINASLGVVSPSMLFFTALAAQELGFWSGRYSVEDSDLPGTVGWTVDESISYLIANGYIAGYPSSQVQPVAVGSLPGFGLVAEPVLQPGLEAGPSFSLLTPVGGDPMAALEPGADLRDFGINGAGADVGFAALGVMALSRLLAMLPAALRGVVGPAIRALGGVGTRIGWTRLPSWVQTVLVTLGVSAGIDILIDTGVDDTGLVQVPGTSDLSAMGVLGGVGMPGLTIVKRWTANGVPFVMLSDGRLGARNKRGIWKVWRPKKPIVIYAGGANNLNTMLRADKALNGQAKRIAEMLRRRAAGPRPRSKKEPSVVVIGADGQRITNVK
jgi:hypothetical protein